MESSPRRRPATQAQLEALYREAVAIVRAEFAGPLTLGDVASRVASSPRQLRRAFDEFGSTTFRRFLTETRMAQAVALLASTDLEVSEVGKRVGYRQASQFTKAFKRVYSATPSQFRAGGANRPGPGIAF